jgi:hypothetical protein
VPAQPEVAAPAKAGGRPLGELEDAAPVVLRVIKIETPEASVSGVFNFGGVFAVGPYGTSELVPFQDSLKLTQYLESRPPSGSDIIHRGRVTSMHRSERTRFP